MTLDMGQVNVDKMDQNTVIEAIKLIAKHCNSWD